MSEIYEINLTLKTPNEKGKSFNFQEKESDIIYAINSFNNNFTDIKQLKLISIEQHDIHLLLKINKNTEVTARDISYFSKRLYHNKSWSEYSRDKTKLFTASHLKNVTTEYNNTFDDLPIIAQNLNIDLNIPTTELENFSDEQAVQSLQALINIQDIGEPNTIKLRKNTILKIKHLINNALK